MSRTTVPVLLAALAGSLTPVVCTAQTVPLDNGEFEVSIRGARVGTESFSIRRLGTGRAARVIAAAQVRLTLPEGPLNMDALMEASGLELSASKYQNKVSGVESQQIGFELRGSRFEARVASDRGEQVKEYRALPGTVILDRGVAHHFHFLGPRADAGPGTIGVIVPRDGRQARAELALIDSEDLRIGGERLAARHYRLSGDGASWDVWYDDQRRVLQVSDSESGYLAVRVAPPGA